MNKLCSLYSLFLVLCTLSLCALFASCDPEAHWNTDDVTIAINPYNVSAGYIECSFVPSKDSYYLIACVPAQSDYNPLDPKNQKPFMELALDSAYSDYISWRYFLLRDGQTNIAPYASHSLQYGPINHFFTLLEPGTDYWIYAFVVNPETLKPAGRLFLQKVTTTTGSQANVYFEYRVRGYWDYIYPLNHDGKINNHFPYLAATQDSLYIYDEQGLSPEEYFSMLFMDIADRKLTDEVRYGVQVNKNDGWSSTTEFEEGHTYYTAIVSFDGFIGNNVIYKFTWTGEDYEAYFTYEDSIVNDGEDN